MKREQLGDLLAFLVVAEERSFTRAATKAGTSQPSLSFAIRRLEERMGVKLLTRTTRKVTPTEAGEVLLATLRPAFSSIDTQVDSLSELREKPAGLIRLTTTQRAAEDLLMPKIRELLKTYPDIRVEISIDQRLADIVDEKFDGGVRLGEQVQKDMIGLKLGPDLRMAVVGSPEYFKGRDGPGSPHDLTDHNCINMRLPTSGGLYSWEFEKEGRTLNVRVEGQLICDNVPTIIDSAVNGLGLCCVPEDHVEEQIKLGHLVRVLENWTPPFSGYYLYYPSRRQLSLPFRLLIEALKR